MDAQVEYPDKDLHKSAGTERCAAQPFAAKRRSETLPTQGHLSRQATDLPCGFLNAGNCDLNRGISSAHRCNKPNALLKCRPNLSGLVAQFSIEFIFCPQNGGTLFICATMGHAELRLLYFTKRQKCQRWGRNPRRLPHISVCDKV